MEITTFFSELLKQYGFWTTFGTIIAFYTLKWLFEKFSAHIFEKRRIKLKNHPAFKELDRIVEHALNNEFNCDCPIRKAIYRDILIERFKSFRRKLYEFVLTDLDDKKLYPTQHDFYVKVVSILDEAHAESRSKSIANGIPEFVLDRMDKERSLEVGFFRDSLKGIIHAEYFSRSNKERMSDILLGVQSYCKSYMNHLELLLDSYNGDITNLNYHGIICKNCKVCVHDEYIRKMKQTLK